MEYPLGRASSKRSIAQHWFDVKLISGILGVGKWLYRWRHRDTEACQLCEATVEDITHVYRCQHQGEQDIWDKEIQKLADWVEDSTQSSRLAEYIRLMLVAYRANGPPTPPLTIFGMERRLWEEQFELGRVSLLNGFISRSWLQLVAQESSGLRSHSAWLSKWIVKLKEFTGALWGRRNELIYQKDGVLERRLREEVTLELERGSGDNQRLCELHHEASRPRDGSTIPYLRFWLSAFRAARLVQQPREVRQNGMREIMYRFLQSRREERGPA
jgi:hypothetical protein